MQVKPLEQNNRYPMIIIAILFFVFGFVTWLNGTLIPFLKLACQKKENEVENNNIYFKIILDSQLVVLADK